MICALRDLVSGVVVPGLTAESAWITWYPNSVLTGLETSFVGSRNAVVSNAATVWPLVIVSLPPLSYDPGSCEYFFASAAKSPPALISA